MTEDFIYRIHIFKKGGMGGGMQNKYFFIDLNVFTLDYVLKKSHNVIKSVLTKVEVNLIYSGCVGMSVR